MKTGIRIAIVALVGLFSIGSAYATDISITASDGTVRAPIPGMNNSVGHIKLANNGQNDIVIVSAQAKFAKSVEIHDHKMIDGVMKMYQVKSVTIPAGGSVSFETGGLHLMLFNVEQALNDAKLVDVTFNTKNSGSFTLPFEVKSIKMKHMHH